MTSSEKKIKRLRRINYWLEKNLLIFKVGAAKFLVDNEGFFAQKPELHEEFSKARVALFKQYAVWEFAKRDKELAKRDKEASLMLSKLSLQVMEEVLRTTTLLESEKEELTKEKERLSKEIKNAELIKKEIDSKLSK